jgi:hypothetical protein
MEFWRPVLAAEYKLTENGELRGDCLAGFFWGPMICALRCGDLPVNIRDGRVKVK